MYFFTNLEIHRMLHNEDQTIFFLEQCVYKYMYNIFEIVQLDNAIMYYKRFYNTVLKRRPGITKNY